MKQLFTLLLLSFVLFSCSRSEEESEITENADLLISKMKVTVLYPNTLGNNTEDLNFYFQYDNDKRLTKRIGGFLSISGSTGWWNPVFSNQIYTALVYSNNKVTVEDFSSSSEFSVPKKTRLYTLSNNQIIQKEIPHESNDYLDRKLTYKYTNNQLIEIYTTLPKMPYYPPNDYIETYLEKFYFDSNGNLAKTEYILQKDGVNTLEKTVRTFEDYDNSYNPWKKFTLLDDFFYRSLPKNNFRKYTEVEYNQQGEITLLKEQIWSFNYDSKGNISF